MIYDSEKNSDGFFELKPLGKNADTYNSPGYELTRWLYKEPHYSAGESGHSYDPEAYLFGDKAAVEDQYLTYSSKGRA